MVRVVEDLSYTFMFGADYFGSNRSVLMFNLDRGFGPVPSAPRVLFRTAVVNSPTRQNPFCSTRDQLFVQTTTPEPPPLHAPVLVFLTHHRPIFHDIALEDESTLKWDVRQAAETTTVEGFTSIAMKAAAVGPQPQDPQLVLMLPTERFDLEKGTLVGVARAVLWGLPGSPLYCKLMNRSKETTVKKACRVIARLVSLSIRDHARFGSLFDETPCTVDPPLSLQALDQTRVSNETRTEPAVKVQATDPNRGTLVSLQKQKFVDVLTAFI